MINYCDTCLHRNKDAEEHPCKKCLDVDYRGRKPRYYQNEKTERSKSK